MDYQEGWGGGEGDKNIMWEQIKVPLSRLDRRRGGVGALNTLESIIAETGQ